MTTYTWTGANGDISTAADWSPDLPGSLGADDTLQFTGAAAYTVTISNETRTFGDVLVDDPNAILDFASGALSASSFTLDAGELLFQPTSAPGASYSLGAWSLAGGYVDLDGSSALQFNTASDVTTTFGVGLTLAATAGASSLSFGGASGDSLVNLGVIDVTADDAASLTIEDSVNDLGFFNRGLISVGGDSTLTQLRGSVVNQATLDVDGSGLYEVQGTGFTNTGVVEVGAGAEFETVATDVANDALFEVDGGLAVIAGSLLTGGGGALDISNGGVVRVAGAVTEAVTFAGAGTLALGGVLTGAIAGFSADDTLDLTAISGAPAALTLRSHIGDVWTFGFNLAPSGLHAFTFDGAGYDDGVFALTGDGAGGTDVEFDPIATAAAFAAHKAAIDAQTFDFALTDSAASVAANWSALDDSHLTSVTLNDSGTPTLDLTTAEVAAGAGLLAKIANPVFAVEAGGVTTYYVDGDTNNYEAAVSFNDDDIVITKPITAEIDGVNDVVSAVSGASVAFLGAKGAWDTVYGSGVSVTARTLVYFVPLAIGPVSLSVVGGDDDIDGADEGESISLYATDGAWDSVYDGDADVILNDAQAAVHGGGNAIYFDASGGDAVTLEPSGSYSWSTVYGSNGAIVLAGAQAAVVGGGDAVYAGSGYALSLFDTAGNWDSVHGDDLQFTLTEAQAAVTGGGDVAYLDASGADALSLYNTGGAWDTVYGSNAELLLTQAQASLVGGGDIVYADSSGADALSLYDTGGVWDTVYASNAEVLLTAAQASLFGGGDVVYVDGSNADALSLYDTGANADVVHGFNGFGGVIVLANASVSLPDGDDIVYFDGATDDSVTASGHGDSFAFGVAFGADAIAGFGASDTITLSAADFANYQALAPHLAQSGANVTISYGAGVITLENVELANLGAAQFRFV